MPETHKGMVTVPRSPRGSNPSNPVMLLPLQEERDRGSRTQINEGHSHTFLTFSLPRAWVTSTQHLLFSPKLSQVDPRQDRAVPLPVDSSNNLWARLAEGPGTEQCNTRCNTQKVRAPLTCSTAAPPSSRRPASAPLPGKTTAPMRPTLRQPSSGQAEQPASPGGSQRENCSPLLQPSQGDRQTPGRRRASCVPYPPQRTPECFAGFV